MDDYRYYLRRSTCKGHMPELDADESHVLYEEEMDGTKGTISIIRSYGIERVEVALHERNPSNSLWTFRYTTNPSEWPDDWFDESALVVCQLEAETFCPVCWAGWDYGPIEMTIVPGVCWDELTPTAQSLLGKHTADRVVQLLPFTSPAPPEVRGGWVLRGTSAESSD